MKLKMLIALLGLVLATALPAWSAEAQDPDLAVCDVSDLLDSAPLEAMGKGGKGPRCCDPALEPGVGGNPLCFEGHTCCDDGNWSCNGPSGLPTCDPGEVCPAGCGQRNDTCSSNDDCCSQNCKRNGRCA